MHAYDFLFAFDVVDCGLRQCPHDFQVSKIIYRCSIFVLIDSLFSQYDWENEAHPSRKKQGCASVGWWMTEIHQRRDNRTILSMYGWCSQSFFDSHQKIMKKCQKFMNKFLELDFMLRWRFSIFFHLVRLTRHRVRFCATLLFFSIKWHHHYSDPCEWIAAINNWA